MSIRSLRAPRRGLAVLAALCLALGAAAQPAGSADPVSVWDHDDNPASWGFFPDAMAVGVRASAPLVALSDPASLAGTVDAIYGLRGLAYSLSTDTATGSLDHAVSSAAAAGPASFGARVRWGSALASSASGYALDLGLALRPWNFLALTARADDLLAERPRGSYPDAAFGVALRPLAFSRRLETLLTLSADAGYRGGTFAFDSVGARLLLEPWLSLDGRYELPGGTFGVELLVSLSGAETTGGYASKAGSALSEGSVSLASALRVGRAAQRLGTLGGSSGGPALGKAALVIEGPGIYASVPPRLDLDMGLGEETDIWLGQALEALERAASDPAIAALVFLEPPLFESDARAQEFGRALARFKAAGKPIFVHARIMERLGYAYAAAQADVVALDPNGSLAVVDAASFSLYFKRLLAKLGIETYNLRSHDTKTAYNSFSEEGPTEAERAMKERYVRGLASQAYAALDAARGPRLSGGAAAAIAAGPYLDPSAAVSAGLVDELLYREEFLDLVDERAGTSRRVDIRAYARDRDLSWGEPPAKRVAVVYLSGSIIEGPGIAGQSIGDAAAELLAELREDASIAGVVLRVDSGGGSALTSDHIAREVRLLREAGKPVVASMASYAASGGYYVSALADRIFAEEGTITGSIGVTGLQFNLTGLLETLGVGVGSVSASDSGEFGNPLLPRREADEERMAGMIRYTYDRFVAVVAEGRGLEASRVDELGRGQIWLGSEAVDNGLVDAIGGLDAAKSAMAELAGGPVRFVDYLPGELEPNALAMLLGTDARSSDAGLASALASLLPAGAGDAAEAAISAASELSAMGSGLLYLEPAWLERRR